MWQLAQKILDIIFPPRSEELRIRSLELVTVRAVVQPVHTNYGVALLPFKEPVVAALLHEAKYWHNRHAQKLLAAIVAEHLQTLPYPHLAVIPIPLSATRERERGYNQVTAVLKHCPHLNLVPLLRRARHTTPQTELDRAARLTNLTDAFVIAAPKELATLPLNTHIIVDDVTTTGATLQEAKATLAKHTTQPISCLAFAH